MQVMKMPSQTWAFLSRTSLPTGKEISKILEEAFEQLTEKIARAGIRTQGKPRAHFHYRDGADVGFDIGFPIASGDLGAARKAGLEAGEIALGEAFVHIHKGPYERLSETYREMERTMDAKGLKGRGDLWEVYLNDPDECLPSDLLTQIVWPVERNFWV